MCTYANFDHVCTESAKTDNMDQSRFRNVDAWVYRWSATKSPKLGSVGLPSFWKPWRVWRERRRMGRTGRMQRMWRKRRRMLSLISTCYIDALCNLIVKNAMTTSLCIYQVIARKQCKAEHTFANICYDRHNIVCCSIGWFLCSRLGSVYLV